MASQCNYKVLTRGRETQKRVTAKVIQCEKYKSKVRKTRPAIAEFEVGRP